MDPDSLLEKSQRLLEDVLNSSRQDFDIHNSFYNTAQNGSVLKRTFWSMDEDNQMPKSSFKSSFMEQTFSRGQKNSLHFQFLETLQKCRSFEDVFDTIFEFNENISEVLCQLRATRTTDNEYMEWLDKEINIWRLVCALYQYRLSPPSNDLAVGHITEKTIVELLYKNDSHIAECQLIIDWLEKSAADEAERLEKPSLEYFTDKTIAWENTLYQLMNDRALPFSSKKQIVSSMDPDAPAREKKNLHPLDEEDERRLLSQIFREVRCGRLDNAKKLCMHVGQAWRAFTLEGWRLFHDPNYDLPSKGNERLPIEGNPSRDLWKLSAWGLSECQSSPREWRATLGAYCGNLDAVLLMCNTWEDILWAHLKVYVDLRVEEEVRENVLGRCFVPMPDKYWNQKFDLDKVFQELENCHSQSIKQEARKPDRELEQSLILDDMNGLFSNLNKFVSNENCPSYLLRLAAHIVIIFRLFERNSDTEIGDQIIKAYIKDCIKRSDPNLVAYYVSHLNTKDQNQVYADYLESVLDSNERSECLKAAEKYHLQIREITNLVVDKVKQKPSKVKKKIVLPETTEEDLEKINVIDWITFYPEQRADALWKTNEFVRLFVLQDKLDAARLALGKINEDIINTLCEGTDLTCHTTRNSSAIREYLCHKAYLSAEESFNDWFQSYNGTKPRMPPKLGENVTYSERVTYESKMEQYEKTLEEWTNMLKVYSKTTKSKLYNVLLFPNGGWMVDQLAADDDRQKQLQSLRKSVIPKVVSLLYSLLCTMKEHNEILDLADIVVSEKYELFKVYSKDELEDLLGKLADSAKELLKINPYP